MNIYFFNLMNKIKNKEYHIIETASKIKIQSTNRRNSDKIYNPDTYTWSLTFLA